MNNAKITKILSLASAVFTIVFISGMLSEVAAQGGRDPFQKNPIYKKRDAPAPRPAVTTTTSNGVTSSVTTPKKRGPYIVEAPSAEARIAYFRQVREQAATSGQPIPKPTSVILLDELSVTGIFRTPRGYAAIVKAEPINLSYTIYPGEKFFDGQLVAVEENRLVFRKVSKWSTGKFVSSVENKALRQYSDQQTIQGTAPAETYSSRPESAQNDKKESTDEESAPAVVISPLEEMTQKANEEPADSAQSKSSKKKTTSKKRKKRSKKIAKRN